MATDYGQHPAVLLGVDPLSESALAWNILEPVWTFGTWADARREATREVPDHRPKKQRPTRIVPRYPTLADVLGIPREPDRTQDPDVIAEAKALLTGEMDFDEWFAATRDDDG